MRLERASGESGKGWYLGPWNSLLAIAIGYANEGIDEPHAHTTTTEIYLVGRGSATVHVPGDGPDEKQLVPRHTFGPR